MKNQFVPYHIALDLKELVFDDFKMFGWYIKEDDSEFGKSLHTIDDRAFYFNVMYCFKTPLWQQVEEWFREKHGILISVDAVKYRRGNLEWGYFISIRNSGGYIITGCEHKGIEDPYKIPYYHSYEEAREAAVLEAIELLKEKNYEQI